MDLAIVELNLMERKKTPTPKLNPHNYKCKQLTCSTVTEHDYCQYLFELICKNLNIFVGSLIMEELFYNNATRCLSLSVRHTIFAKQASLK